MLKSETLQRAVSGRTDMPDTSRFPSASVVTANYTSGDGEENGDRDGDTVFDERVDEVVPPYLRTFFLVFKSNDAEVLRDDFLPLVEFGSPFLRFFSRHSGYGASHRLG